MHTGQNVLILRSETKYLGSIYPNNFQQHLPLTMLIGGLSCKELLYLLKLSSITVSASKQYRFADINSNRSRFPRSFTSTCPLQHLKEE